MLGCSLLLIYGTWLPFILSAPAIIFEFQSDCSLRRLLNSTPQWCHSQASASISSQVSLSLPESPPKPLHLWRPFWTTPSSLLYPQSFQPDPVNQDVTSVFLYSMVLSGLVSTEFSHPISIILWSGGLLSCLTGDELAIQEVSWEYGYVCDIRCHITLTC